MDANPRTKSGFDHRQARRAGTAAFVGTAIEWYDFYIYATAAALVFGPLFFPESDRMVGIAAAFATYAVGFFVRPLGAIIFGHIGDRFGRRPSLVITLLAMGLATVLVGVLPTYDQVGVWAPVLLLALRVVQGLAVGGEWGGAVLMAVEHAPEKHKTFYGGFPQLGNSAGALAATGTFSVLSVQGDDFLIDGGWRIPFLLSMPLILLGFWVRYRLEESPVFDQSRDDQPQQLPLTYALKTNWHPMLLGIGMAGVSTGGYYIVTSFATAYATDPAVGLSETLVLNALAAAAFVEFVTTLAIAWLGDRYGRKRVVMIGVLGSGALIVPQFLTLGGGSVWAIFAAFIAMRLAMTATYAPVATVMAQMFRPQARYTSMSLSNGIAAAIWGGLGPVTATWLYVQTGTIWSVIVLFLGMVAVSAVCLHLAPQHIDPAPDAGERRDANDESAELGV
ncbi:MFS transporter [Zhihengliuella halotolerans]|uniref:Putative proline/betaine transporter n=1 Tax=Zhihengliuella halotolerans TaxID=370736 RepID=A0A4Q8ADD6_9MICC|nr:MFS transporter [Zhihengliuella halotolerans]RZU62144.1 nitrate/nitrite transporter NarK [Zhihengliuella halotolerans]